MKRFARFTAAAVLAGLCLTAGAAPFLITAEAQQTVTPAASLSFRNVAALALNADGSRLLIADSATNAASIYNTSEIDSPELLQMITLDGTPLAATWINQDDSEFALIIVDADDAILLQVLALGSPREGWIPYAIYDMAGDTEHITAGVDGHWAAAYGAGGSVLMEIISGSELNSSVVSDQEVAAAALTETMLLAAGSDSDLIAIGTTVDGPAIGEVATLSLEDSVITLAAGRDDLVAAITDAPALVLFQPSTQEIISTLPLRSSTSGLVFMPFASGDNFAIFQPGARSISFVPAVGDAAITAVSVRTTNPVQLAAGAGSILVTTNGQRADIYGVE